MNIKKRKRKYKQLPVIKVTASMMDMFGLIVDIAILLSIWFTYVLSVGHT